MAQVLHQRAPMYAVIAPFESCPSCGRRERVRRANDAPPQSGVTELRARARELWLRLADLSTDAPPTLRAVEDHQVAALCAQLERQIAALQRAAFAPRKCQPVQPEAVAV